jgi:hypothetical protein
MFHNCKLGYKHNRNKINPLNLYFEEKIWHDNHDIVKYSCSRQVRFKEKLPIIEQLLWKGTVGLPT